MAIFPTPGATSGAVTGEFKIGQVIQSPVDLEALYPGEFMRLDGRDVLRSAVSATFLGTNNANFPAGVFTSTARSAPQNNVYPFICAGPSHFIKGGREKTNGELQYSADGASWTALSLTTAWAGTTCAATSMIYAGSRYIATETAFAKPVVCSGDPTNQENWSATTGGFITTSVQALAYSPSLGLTVGIPSASGATIYTLADGATAWTAQTAASTQTKGVVIWTGQKFIVAPSTDTPAVLQVSSNGTTWTDQSFPIRAANYVIGLATDGNGTVVMTVYAHSNSISTVFCVSKDHGATWRFVTPPIGTQRQVNAAGYPHETSPNHSLRYINGRFAAVDGGYCGWYFSIDGLTWAYEPINLRGCGGSVASIAMAYKSGVYVGGYVGSTSMWSATEDMTKFKLHATPAFSWGYYVSTAGGAANYQEYIKVA